MQSPNSDVDSNEPFDISSGHLGQLLASLAPEVRATLQEHARFRHIPAGTVVIENGQRSDEIGYVIDGTLGMTQVIDGGRKHIIGLLVPSDFYGHLFDGPSSYRIEALSDTKLYCFERTHFERVLRLQPDAERLFVVHILDELDAAREWLLLISGRKVIHRAASFLTILVRRAKPQFPFRPITVHLPLSRKDLAQYLGTRPESLSRSFHELEDKGILRILDPYMFEILDLDALIEISGQDLVIEG